MRKGETTRRMILREALAMASEVGLSGLSLSPLAARLKLSKSGLFAHFQSKEALQMQVLDYAALRFIENVIRPALAVPEGEERIRAMFDHWLDWPKSDPLPGGCFFVSAATELDDRPGPLRDRLVQLQRRWLGVIAEMARMAAAEDVFRSDLDCEQFAHDVYGVMLAYHHSSRLLRDPRSRQRVRTAFEALVRDARNPGEPSPKPSNPQEETEPGARAARTAVRAVAAVPRPPGSDRTLSGDKD